MPITTDNIDILGDASKAVKNFEKNGVPYYYKYDDKSIYILIGVCIVLVVVTVIATGYFKAKVKNA